MTPQRAVDKVNEDWVYQPDRSVDRWSFSTPGDCENYSLRVLSKIGGSNKEAYYMLMNQEAYIWYVKTLSGNGHAVLEYQGRFVDNRYQEWKDSLDDMRLLDSPRKRYSRFQISIKMLFGIGL